MARSRSRRTHRRSATQTAASLLALALPAPVQRVADTRLGPLLMLVGVPTAIVAGLINIDWNGGTPSLSIDQQRAAEIRNVARDQLNNFDSQGGLQNLGQAASDLLSHAQDYANQNLSQSGFNVPAFGQTTGQPVGYNQPSGYNQSLPSTSSRNPSAAFPSTQAGQQAVQRGGQQYAQQYTLPNAQLNSQAAVQRNTQQDWRSYTPSTITQNSNTYQAPAANQGLATQGYVSQGANQSYSPSDTRGLSYQQQEQLYRQQQLQAQQLQQQQLQAQQLQQQQLQQQQLYEQQLKQYQYQQWLAQQAISQQAISQQFNTQTGTQPYANQAPVNYGYTQTDAYGRPVSTGYPPATQPSQYGQQYSQPNYNQGSLPSANTHGRY